MSPVGIVTAMRSTGSRPGVDVTANVRVDGPPDAPTLVMLHGFSGSLKWFDRLVERLDDTFRIVRIDLLGHGATGGHAADAPAQMRMVDDVLARLDIEDAVVLGHSFGADVAVELAEHSGRVTRLIIVAQAPDYTDATLPRGRVIMTVPLISTAVYRIVQPIGRVVARAAARRNPDEQELAAQALADFRALDPAMFRVVLVDRRDRMARRPLDAQVRVSGKPTLVILGGRDHFYGARSAQRYTRAGARVEILAESGHNPTVEFPDETAALIKAFLATTE
jgi:pimeloyl-ACP methyl ester carboxylesterase